MESLKVRLIFVNIILSIFIQKISIGQTVEDLEHKKEKYKNEVNKIELMSVHNKLGTLYWQKGNLEEAIVNYKEAIHLSDELGNINAQRIISGYLGLIYLEKGDYNEAVLHFNTSLRLNLSAKKIPEIISDYVNIANALQELGNYSESNINALKAIEKSLEINNLSTAKTCNLILAENYEKLGDSKKAAEYFSRYNTLEKHLQKEQLSQLKTEKEEIQSEKKQIQSEKQQIQSEKQQIEKELKTTEDKMQEVSREMQLQKQLHDIRLKKQRERIYYLSIALLLFLGILLLFLIQNRVRKKTNLKLKEQNNKIEQQKTEIEKQRDLANSQRKNLTDSIQYARRIQSAVIPRPENLHEHFKDSFIMYRPRDIVSGDFYWFAQKDELFVIAAVDCTGHGVPGAFMSMLGVAYLNEIVNKIAINIHINALNADEILNQLRDKVISSLHQSESREDSKDGMDMALCIVDFENKKLQFAGAYNSLVIVRKGEIIKYKGDKMPVSYHLRKDIPFTRHTIQLEENDCMYLFSDGYIDQFGGEQGRKFLINRFTKQLLEIHHKPMQEQKAILEYVYDEWKGDNIQIDDVLVIGFRFAHETQSKEIEWKDKTLLIAEDTDINFYLLAEVLKKTKVKIIRVKDGVEAVKMAKANRIDLVLMDINMPSMNGYDATKEIKKFDPGIPVIIQTAVHEDSMEKAIEAGAEDFIAKPIDLKAFMGKISRLLK